MVSPDNRGRLREIISIFKKYHVMKGLDPQKVRAIVQDLGPTFIKLAQIMSMRPDLLPPAYCKELSGLCMNVLPMQFCEIRKVLEQEYHTAFENLFIEFSENPIGSASIAQVHKAVLRDHRVAAVKIQRPDIRERMEQDIQLLRQAAGIVKIKELNEMVDFQMILDEMWIAAQQETDFLIEAENMNEFYARNEEIRFVSCPRVIQEYTTSKILVMEYIDGISIIKTETLLGEEYDLSEIGLKLADNYVKQIIEDGYFHADPHPGNLVIRDGQIIWLDFGMMGRLTKQDQSLIKSAVKAIAKKNAKELADACLVIGNCTKEIDYIRFLTDVQRLLNKYVELEIGRMNFGDILEDLTKLAREYGLSLPKGIFLLFRGILNLEGVISMISPDINLIQILTNRLAVVVFRDIDWKKELKNKTGIIYEGIQKGFQLPRQLSEYLTFRQAGHDTINLNILGAEQPLERLEQMIHDGIYCMLFVALFLGACILCLSSAGGPMMFGVPALGFFGLVMSVIAGFIFLLIRLKKRKK